MARPELVKWDVHPFVTHKRACMPKLALQQVIGDFFPSYDLFPVSSIVILYSLFGLCVSLSTAERFNP